MDSRHPDLHNSNPNAFGGNFAFNRAPQTDPFNGFLQNDHEPAFNNTWDPSSFTDNQDAAATSFGQGNQDWISTNFQGPNYTAPDYGIADRPYDQAYSRIPASFDYSNFRSNAQQTLSTPAYDPRLNIQTPLTNQSNYNFSNPQGSQNYQSVPNQSQTISPQALQHYPNPYSQVAQPKVRQQQPSQSALALQSRGQPVNPGAAQRPLDGEAWRSITANFPDSVTRRELLIRDAIALSTSAKSKKTSGSAFLSNGDVAVSSTKANIPKAIKRRSKSEVRKLLLQEKGTGPWNLAREPLRKKLKVAGAGSAISRSSSTPRGTPTADSPSSADSSSESASDDDSNYESASDDEAQFDTPSPLLATRPSDPNKATEYDTVKAVWAKRNVSLSGAVIRSALSEYWDIVRGIRDQWKSETQKLQQAAETKDSTKLSEVKSRVEGKRRLLESCLRLTLKHGHRDIVKRLGENPIMCAVFSQFLINRTNENEYSGPLIVSILELMNRWLKIEQETLEKTKLDKLLPRLVKKGDDQVKGLAQSFLEKSGLNLKKASSDGKPGQSQAVKETAALTPPVDSSRLSDVAAGTKRPKPTETSGSPPSKKQSGSAAASNAPKTVSLLEKRRQQAAKHDAKAPGKSPATAVVPEKVKANHITAKPSAFFSSLQSASKKPGVSKLATAAGKAKDGTDSSRSSDNKALGGTSKPAFSFADTMASLNKQKNEAPSKSEESRPDETPDQRRKRLRKEQRRKLRVSFKADDDLVEVRTFEHDPEEELGHDDSMVRDVGDSRGEGQMLKMHKDLDLMDDDDDYEPAEELPILWHSPSLVDFSVIEKGEVDRNYSTRGGKVEVLSQEKAVQEERERSKLLVIYTSFSDIPSSPREPPEPLSDEPSVLSAEKAFGAPKPDSLTKEREKAYYNGPRHRQGHLPNAPMLGQSGQPQVADVSALLRMFNPQTAPQQYQQPPSQTTQAPTAGLEAIFAQFASNQQLQQPQPQMIPAPQQPAAPSFDLQAALAAMHMPNQTQPAYASAAQSQPPNLQALLAQIGQPAAAPMQNYNYPNMYQSEYDRKRPADSDDQANGNYGYGQNKRQKGGEKKVHKYHNASLQAFYYLGSSIRLHRFRAGYVLLTLPFRALDQAMSGSSYPESINHLIIVCCHAICLCGPSNRYDSREWLIEGFQDPRETATFVKHIEAGLRLLNENSESMLAFSGGPTKRDRTELSEAKSYSNVARSNNYFNILRDPELEKQILLEENAVDSYQNLLFSILLYRSTVLRWPNHITLISHDFKKQRFVELHCPAIRWPGHKLTFVGINPPDEVVPTQDLVKGEEKRGYGAFAKDPYGALGYLREKREARGWTQERLFEKVDEPALPKEVKNLLAWEGGEGGAQLFGNYLPWEGDSES